MYYNNPNEYSAELAESLLKRYMSLGCTLNEAIECANKNFYGEPVLITSKGETMDEDDLGYGGGLDPGALLDYLLYDLLGDNNIDSDYYYN